MPLPCLSAGVSGTFVYPISRDTRGSVSASLHFSVSTLELIWCRLLAVARPCLWGSQSSHCDWSTFESLKQLMSQSPSFKSSINWLIVETAPETASCLAVWMRGGGHSDFLVAAGNGLQSYNCTKQQLGGTLAEYYRQICLALSTAYILFLPWCQWTKGQSQVTHWLLKVIPT